MDPNLHNEVAPDMLSNFKLAEVLDDDAGSKQIIVLGSFEGKPGQAIVKLSRCHFERDNLAELLSTTTFQDLHFQNDIYSKYAASLPAKWNMITVDMTYPATEKHIRKARKQQYYMVRETLEVYSQVTLPHIQSIPQSHLQWVHNILAQKAEVERLLFEDPDPDTGFMLHPDLKWDQAQKESLYCVAICHSREVRSLRDLTKQHLPMLRNVRHKATRAIRDKFGVEPNQLRLYVHYQPSYYHFHVHIVHISLPAPGATVGKAHLLDDIIENINMNSDYYRCRTMTYSLGANDVLMERLMKRKALDDPLAPDDEAACPATKEQKLTNDTVEETVLK